MGFPKLRVTFTLSLILNVLVCVQCSVGHPVVGIFPEEKTDQKVDSGIFLLHFLGGETSIEILSYPIFPVFTRGQVTAPYIPTVVGENITLCSVVPALPAGLTLSTTDCTIQGSPLGSSSISSHQVVASVSSGSNAIANITIQVDGDFRYIFVTLSAYNGNLGGKTGADVKCNSDIGKFPITSTFSAVLGVYNGGQRYACLGSDPGCSGGGSLDWPLLTNMQYRRIDGVTIIGTTNANQIIPQPLNNPIATSGTAWSGMEGNWNTLTGTSECSGWAGTGGWGNTWNLSDSTSTNAGNTFCTNSLLVVCAEL